MGDWGRGRTRGTVWGSFFFLETWYEGNREKRWPSAGRVTPLADLGLDCEVRLSESVVGEADYLVKFQFDGFDISDRDERLNLWWVSGAALK